MKTRRLNSSPLFALGCSCDSLGAPTEDFTIQINGNNLPASQVFTDDFLNQRTIPSVQQLASTLLSGSAGSPPVVNDDGSVTVKGLVVVPAGGSYPDALYNALGAQASIPGNIPLSSTPASILTQPTANWWTADAHVNTTDAALNRLEQDIRNNIAAVTDQGAVVGGGFNVSTGRTPVYVTLQPAGAVNVALFAATGGRVFSQTAPNSLVPVAARSAAQLPTPTTTTSGDFFTKLFGTTAQQVAVIKTNQLVSNLTPPPPPLPNQQAQSPKVSLFPSGNMGLGGNIPLPPVAPIAPVSPTTGFSGNLGLGFAPPSPPPSPSYPAVRPDLSQSAFFPTAPAAPVTGGVISPALIQSGLSTAPAPGLPIYPGVPLGGDSGSAPSAPTFLKSLDNTPAAAPFRPAATPWLKYGLIAGGVLAVSYLLLRTTRGGGAPYRRRRRVHA